MPAEMRITGRHLARTRMVSVHPQYQTPLQPCCRMRLISNPCAPGAAARVRVLRRSAQRRSRLERVPRRSPPVNTPRPADPPGRFPRQSRATATRRASGA
eukprot:5805724-Prymnesium_polylepis.2